jgi:hypothetical protein
LKTTVGNVASATATALSRMNVEERRRVAALLTDRRISDERLHAAVKQIVVEASRQQIETKQRVAAAVERLRGIMINGHAVA